MTYFVALLAALTLVNVLALVWCVRRLYWIVRLLDAGVEIHETPGIVVEYVPEDDIPYVVPCPGGPNGPTRH